MQDLEQSLTGKLRDEAARINPTGPVMGEESLRHMLAGTARQEDLLAALKICGTIYRTPDKKAPRYPRTGRRNLHFPMTLAGHTFAVLEHKTQVWQEWEDPCGNWIRTESSLIRVLEPEIRAPDPYEGTLRDDPESCRAFGILSRDRFRIRIMKEPRGPRKPAKPRDLLTIPENYAALILGKAQQTAQVLIRKGEGQPVFLARGENRHPLMNHGNFEFAIRPRRPQDLAVRLSQIPQQFYELLCKIHGISPDPEHSPREHAAWDFKTSAEAAQTWMDRLSTPSQASEALLEEVHVRRRTPRLIRDVREIFRKEVKPGGGMQIVTKLTQGDRGRTLTRLTLADPEPGYAGRKLLRMQKRTWGAQREITNPVRELADPILREIRICRESTPVDRLSPQSRSQGGNQGIADSPGFAGALRSMAFLADGSPADLRKAVEALRQGRSAGIREGMEAEASIQMLHRGNPEELLVATRMSGERHGSYSQWAAFTASIIVRQPGPTETPNPMDPAVPGPDSPTRNLICALATANAIAGSGSLWEILSLQHDRPVGIMEGRPGRPREYGRKDMHQMAALLGACAEKPQETFYGHLIDQGDPGRVRRDFWLSMALNEPHRTPMNILEIKQEVWWATQRPDHESKERLRALLEPLDIQVRNPWAMDCVRTSFLAKHSAGFAQGQGQDQGQGQGQGQDREENTQGLRFLCAFRIPALVLAYHAKGRVLFVAAETFGSAAERRALEVLNRAKPPVEVQMSTGRMVFNRGRRSHHKYGRPYIRKNPPFRYSKPKG